MSEILTEKQEALLLYIEHFQLENGASPTIKQMREYFGVSSDNSILKHLNALEDKGRITKEDGKIKLLSNIKAKLQKETIRLPLMGRVPAGNPVDNQENIETWMEVGEDIVYQNKQSFLLRVSGNSMINAGIYDGDIVVVCSVLEPKAGDIVVALVDNQTTVKRYMISQGTVYLKPENPEYENIYPENELCIQGVVTGMIRYYKR